eukprot:scaffold7452_cov95-Isochrysis_galbana.AAC.1
MGGSVPGEHRCVRANVRMRVRVVHGVVLPANAGGGIRIEGRRGADGRWGVGMERARGGQCPAMPPHVP